jgi:hypothetical protein
MGKVEEGCVRLSELGRYDLAGLDFAQLWYTELSMAGLVSLLMTFAQSAWAMLTVALIGLIWLRCTCPRRVTCTLAELALD